MSYKKLIRLDSNKFYDERNIKKYYKTKDSNFVKRISCSQNLGYSVCTLSLLGNLNVGTIMRTSQMFGVDKYFVFGRRIFDNRSTVGSEKYMNVVRVFGIEGFDENQDMKLMSKIKLEDRILCPIKFYDTMIKYNLVPVFIEQTADAIYDDQINWNLMHAKIPDDKQLCFVFGNEGDGISKDILKVGKLIPGSFVICIRQLGALQSLNVSAAAAMIMYNYKSWAIKKRLDYLDLNLDTKN